MPNKFFLYARKSTDVEDKQIMSIEAQLNELRELAKRENLEVIEELIEKQSAKIPGRPIFNNMLNLIEKGKANGILSWHPDRLARNSVDGGRIIYLIDTGRLSALKFNTFWFEPTPQGKFMLSIAFSQSKYYVDSLSENTRRGLRQKARNGYYPGKVPIGYLNDSRTKTIAVDKKISPLIVSCFTKYAKGNIQLKKISSFLASKGIVTSKNKGLRIDKMKKILSNSFYYGVFKYAGDIFEGRHDPIISKKLFDEVQEVLKTRNHQWQESKIQKVFKPFLGLIRCGECGMMVTGDFKNKYYKRTNNHASYCYYRCTKKNKSIKCSQPHIIESYLDFQLTTLIKKYSLRNDWASQMLNKLEEEESDVAQSSLDVATIKRREIDKINIKLKFLLDSYLDQIIDKESFQEKKLELASQKKTFEEQILSNQKRQGSWIEPFRNWITEASNVHQIISMQDKQAKKGLALKIFGSNLFLENKKVRGEAQNQWSALRADPTGRSYVPRRGVEPPHRKYGTGS